jgi:hypothetical protein
MRTFLSVALFAVLSVSLWPSDAFAHRGRTVVKSKVVVRGRGAAFVTPFVGVGVAVPFFPVLPVATFGIGVPAAPAVAAPVFAPPPPVTMQQSFQQQSFQSSSSSGGFSSFGGGVGGGIGGGPNFMRGGFQFQQ